MGNGYHAKLRDSFCPLPVRSVELALLTYLDTWTVRLHGLCGPQHIFYSSRLLAGVHGGGLIRTWPLARVSYRVL
ncbi:hypothetical protein KIN20_036649 [Parelaphostrongylus tenuis]|uniref:Uncharacterized protein n=1 Tax=Parelaphostrongylus tenuis TaxID=148309 RepID=A0AAD5RDF6_PARTN|nr:hypothetical protein KIN20_036649 [Parelaphostrongylus tenuis]